MHIFRYFIFSIILFQVQFALVKANNCDEQLLNALQKLNSSNTDSAQMQKLLRLRSDMAMAKTAIAFLNLRKDSDDQKIEKLKASFKSSNQKYSKEELGDDFEKVLSYIDKQNAQYFHDYRGKEYSSTFLFDMLAPISKKYANQNNQLEVNNVDTYLLHNVLVNNVKDQNLFHHTLVQMREHFKQRKFEQADIKQSQNQLRKSKKEYLKEFNKALSQLIDQGSIDLTPACFDKLTTDPSEGGCINLQSINPNTFEELEKMMFKLAKHEKDRDDLITLDPKESQSLYIHFQRPKAKISCEIKDGNIKIKGDFTYLPGITKPIWSLKQRATKDATKTLSEVPIRNTEGKEVLAQDLTIKLDPKARFLKFSNVYYEGTKIDFNVNGDSFSGNVLDLVEHCGLKLEEPAVELGTSEDDSKTDTEQSASDDDSESEKEDEEEKDDADSDDESEVDDTDTATVGNVKVKSKSEDTYVKLTMEGEDDDVKECYFSTCNSPDAEYEDGKDEDDEDAVACVKVEKKSEEFDRRFGESYYVYLFCGDEKTSRKRKVISECDSMECLESQKEGPYTPMGPPAPRPAGPPPQAPDSTITIKRL